MSVLLEKMGLILALLILGYMTVRFKIVPADFTKSLSRLVMNVLLAGLILSSVINKDIPLGGWELVWAMLMISLAYVISFAVALVCARLFPPLRTGDSGMYVLLMAFMNNGFMGFPLVAAFFGEEAVFIASLSNIPLNFLLYTVGIRVLNNNGEKHGFSLRQVINIPIIATLLACLIFAFRIPMPVFVDDLCDTVGASVVPLSMMCIGMSLGNVPVKAAVMQPKMYLISFVKLIVSPAVIWLVLRLLISDPLVLGVIMMVMLTPSAAICTIVGLENGRDGVESSSGIFISTLLSSVTIPLMVFLLGIG